jgi:hypothetical protein
MLCTGERSGNIYPKRSDPPYYKIKLKSLWGFVLICISVIYDAGEKYIYKETYIRPVFLKQNVQVIRFQTKEKKIKI